MFPLLPVGLQDQKKPEVCSLTEATKKIVGRGLKKGKKKKGKKKKGNNELQAARCLEWHMCMAEAAG